MRFWFDIMNTPQVHFLLSIKRLLENGTHSFEYTAREFSETAKLLEKNTDAPFKTIGGHHGKKYINKVLGTFDRFLKVYRTKINYDVSISCGSENAVWTSFLKRKKSICFGDNDTARQWTYARFCNYAFFPDAISRELLNKQGLYDNKLYLYKGYKEDLYLADYEPDDSFLDSLPFKEYVVVRPENIMANYIRNGEVKSITPQLLKELSSEGINVLYLPRYDFDKAYADGLANVFIPDAPINGLDACFFADAVLTGAGTFAREAACLGVPSVSFFAGKTLLAVDKKMINEGWMYFSRNVKDIMSHLSSCEKRKADLSRSKEVQREVQQELERILSEF